MVTLYGIYQQPAVIIIVFALLLVWTILWQGFALWFSAKNQQKGWFIALLLLNPLGLLAIIYLAWFRPKTSKDEEPAAFISKRVVKKKRR